MNRDEFMLQRLKDDATTNRRAYPILLGCLVVFGILCIVMFATGSGSVGVGTVLIMVAIALRLPLMKQQIDGADRAISELEAHIADPSVPLSEETKVAIGTSDFPASELFKGWVALAVCSGMLVVMGIGFFVLAAMERSTLLGLLAAGTILGALVVLAPTLRMRRSWKTAKGLEEKGL